MNLQESSLLARDYQTTEDLCKYILLLAYTDYDRNEQTQGEKADKGSISTILNLPSHPIPRDMSTDMACCKMFTPLWNEG